MRKIILAVILLSGCHSEQKPKFEHAQLLVDYDGNYFWLVDGSSMTKNKFAETYFPMILEKGEKEPTIHYKTINLGEQ